MPFVFPGEIKKKATPLDKDAALVVCSLPESSIINSFGLRLPQLSGVSVATLDQISRTKTFR